MVFCLLSVSYRTDLQQTFWVLLLDLKLLFQKVAEKVKPGWSLPCLEGVMLLILDDLDRFDAEARSLRAGVGWLPVHTPPGQGGHR